MGEAISSALLQLVIFSAIPCLWWFITARNEHSFFNWIGLKRIKTENTIRFWLVLFGTIIITCLIMGVLMPIVLGDTTSATSQFAGKGMKALPEILLFAVIQTALSEEVVFRGFIGKRCIARFGFAMGNSMQALLFGLLHGVMMIGAVGIWRAMLAILLTGGIGWLEGYLNERKAGGSIIPSWIFHSISNLLSAFSAALG